MTRLPSFCRAQECHQVLLVPKQKAGQEFLNRRKRGQQKSRTRCLALTSCRQGVTGAPLGAQSPTTFVAFATFCSTRLLDFSRARRISGFLPIRSLSGVLRRTDGASKMCFLDHRTVFVEVLLKAYFRAIQGYPLFVRITISTRRFSCCSSTERSPGTSRRDLPYPWV